MAVTDYVYELDCKLKLMGEDFNYYVLSCDDPIIELDLCPKQFHDAFPELKLHPGESVKIRLSLGFLTKPKKG